MLLITILVFVAVVALLTPVILLVGGSGKSSEKKQVEAVLDSAIGLPSQQVRNTVINFRKSELVSAVPWLNRKLEKLDLVPRIRRMLQQAELKWTPGALILMTLTCFGIPAYLIDWRTGSLLLALGVGIALSCMPTGYVLIIRGKRFKKFEQELPEALDLMVSALRVGHSFSSALGLVSRECPDPLGSEIRIAFDEQNFGLDLRSALENLVTRVPLQDVRIVMTAILIQRESGGNLAEVLEKTANVIRQRFRLRKQVSVHTAQGRMTGWILTVMPIALGFGMYLMNPKTMSLLWTTDIGVKLLWAAGGMMVIGTFCIQKIVRMEV